MTKVLVYGIDGAGLGFPTGGAGTRIVLTSIGEIETTTVDPVTSVTATGNLIFIANTAEIQQNMTVRDNRNNIHYCDIITSQ